MTEKPKGIRAVQGPQETIESHLVAAIMAVATLVILSWII
jgi:hypothetical protein